MKSNAPILKELLAKWQEWSKTADQSEDGWEGCFPEWRPMISSAKMLMLSQNLSDEELHMLEMCWQISEEDQEFVDYSRANLTACWPALLHLATSRFAEVRWQVYEVLGDAGSRADSLLRDGLQDNDAYCRRRAILSLTKLSLPDAKEIAARFVNDTDPYIKQAAMELDRS